MLHHATRPQMTKYGQMEGVVSQCNKIKSSSTMRRGRGTKTHIEREGGKDEGTDRSAGGDLGIAALDKIEKGHDCSIRLLTSTLLELQEVDSNKK